VIICSCRAVSDREVESAIAQGASSIEAVGQLCGAGTDCGSCLEALGERLERSCGRSCSPAAAAACARGSLHVVQQQPSARDLSAAQAA